MPETHGYHFKRGLLSLICSLANGLRNNHTLFGGPMKFTRSCSDWNEMTRTIRTAFSILLCLLAATSLAWAQVRNSTITGSVADQNGGVIPKASITVTNQNTNTAITTVSDAAGDYSVPYLAEGLYSVSVDVPGFRTYHVSDIAVASDVVVRINARLVVGATSQVVEIKASSAELQTENATVAGAIETQVIQNIPNITNNPLYY